MNTWLAGKNILFILGLIALALLLNWLVLQTGRDSQIVPTPDNVAEEFVRSAAAYRWQGAKEQLTESLSAQVDDRRLLQMIKQIEQSRGEIEQVHAKDSQEQGDQASAEIEMTFSGGKTASATFPLEKENYLWKVSAVEPLLEFAAQ